jgi:diguanylate cyclase (GGDEF)-like protein/PAS domain S-box-containing protein
LIGQRPPLVFAALALGVVLTLALVALGWQATLRFHENAFNAEAAGVRDNVLGNIKITDEVITNLATVVGSATHVDADQFRVFSEDVLRRHRFLLSTSYLPLVTGPERRVFERARHASGFPTFRITTRDKHAYLPAPEGERYFPLIYLEPFEPQTAVMIGFNVLSEPELAAPALAAVDSGVASPAAPRLLDQGVRGYWLFKAVYAGKEVPSQAADRRSAVHGLVALRISAETLLQDALASRAMDVRLRMYPSPETAAVEVIASLREPAANTGAALLVLARSDAVSVGGQRLELDMRRPVLWRDVVSVQLVATLLTGLLITALLVLAARQAQLRAGELQRHATEVEHQVQEKTAELALEKERAQVTLASIADAVITTDGDGRIDYLNPVAEQLTGWRQDEARGRPLESVFHTRGAAADPAGEPDASAKARDGVLVSRTGGEIAIDQSVAPISAENGEVLGSVLVFHDVSQQRRMVLEMSHQATHDALTGLLNRRAFEDRLEDLLVRARLHGHAHVMLYLDLDQFKIVNDACGHAAGDQLLRQLSALVSRETRTSDSVARLGGDEFGVLLQQCGVDDALPIAQKLLQLVNDFRFVWKERTFTIGASVGLVPITAAAESVAAILTAADAACYAAKDKGRNRVFVYQAHDTELTERRTQMQWVTRLKQAVAEDRLVLYAQPIVPLAPPESGRVQQEVLVRLRDEDGGLVPPGAFLPAAERYGLMPAIDRWVVRTTLQWLVEHQRHPGLAASYNINLSGQSLTDAEFLDRVLGEIRASGVPPERICFEITETAAVATLDTAIRVIGALRDAGCRFLLDDFGSGWSSFAYLRNLPVDFLKIDGSFVRDMLDDPVDEAMVRSIHHIGHVMGVRTIAEFAESAEALQRLRDMGVDYAQGFAVAMPAAIDEHLRPATVGTARGDRKA